MKVPLNVSYNLVKGKHIAQKKSIAGLCRLLFNESPDRKGQEGIIGNASERDRKYIISSPGQMIGHKFILNPGQRTG